MFELYLLTFNCARALVDPQALAPSLFDALPKAAPLPDLVAISLQEIAPIAYSFLGGSYLKPYFDRVTTTVQLAAHLHSNGSEQLEHIATRSLGMTALMIFAKPKFAERIQWIQSAGAGVGFSNMGNKGAIAMRVGLSCPGTDDLLHLTFAAAHLAPMESNVQPRNKDWENIVRNLVFVNGDESAYSSSEETPLLVSSGDKPADHNGLFTAGNHVFFYGDLNYRTHDTPPGDEDYKSYPQPTASESSPLHYSQLLENDQLTRERQASRTLHGFEELPISFPPTYKYSTSHAVKSSDDERWEWSKHRYPSWCDRILYLPSLSSSKFEPQIYTALPVQNTSDHRPVALSLRIDDKPIPLDPDDIRSQPPFPINPQWKARRDAARRWEIIVGILSYLTLTGKGNAILVTGVGALLGSLWIAGWLSR
ncbi:inositol 5-phosphatase-like protein [Cucurbitaria berberidis CBS 394.84]|uniref:Inositol 5-phosphatase-like protein n=1 Tax=Cucurbitaria berberidis CBS 394.84 TaxID=1168544 RepID=A0A9P4GMG8_9PLEO|nr:inositol 5-phosphatase-like protein [Cucurbitaria berberidis CBS 394.84]KAF1849118.1 inositol 5-phosphatase-like protein [Cucurbitaria berberidis CBS 394.84]